MGNRISIVIPAYNSAKYLREAVDSALAQTRENVEVVVVNDGSTDNSADILHDYGDKIVYIEQENAGLSAARNAGILASTGDFLVFLDADDRILADMAARMSLVLERNSDCGLAYCGWFQIDDTGKRFAESELDLPSGRVFSRLFQRGLFLVGTAMVRRSVLAKSGLFDPALPQIEDRDMWIRIALHSDFIFVPGRLFEYRSTPTSMSRNWAERKIASRLLIQKMYYFLKANKQPVSLLRCLKHSLYSHYADQCVQDAFAYYWRGERGLARKMIMRGVAASPKYLQNRGVLSLILRSTLTSGSDSTISHSDSCDDK